MNKKDLIRFILTQDEKIKLEENFINAKKIALKDNIRLTKSKIVKKVFLEFLKDENFIKQIIKK